jgi:uncharacterized iron-regulated membrane protein
MTEPRGGLKLVELGAAFWRKWHRWIGFPAALFLLFAATTGIIVAGTEFFGEEEALREATRDLASPVSLRSSPAVWTQPIARALATASQRLGNAPVDKITLEFKGDHPRVTIFTGKPTGGEDRKVVVDARTGNLVAVEDYADKPFINRLHSGEAFGDGGLVVAMLWALSLVVLTISGLVIYFQMRRRNLTGIKRFFW